MIVNQEPACVLTQLLTITTTHKFPSLISTMLNKHPISNGGLRDEIQGMIIKNPILYLMGERQKCPLRLVPTTFEIIGHVVESKIFSIGHVVESKIFSFIQGSKLYQCEMPHEKLSAQVKGKKVNINLPSSMKRIFLCISFFAKTALECFYPKHFNFVQNLFSRVRRVSWRSGQSAGRAVIDTMQR